MITNHTYRFFVELEVSNNDAEDVRRRLQTRLEDWLDTISFLTKNDEKVIRVENIPLTAKIKP